MKKNPSLIGLLMILAILGVIVLVYNFVLSKPDGYVIDNPSDQTISLKIDETAYTIAPQQYVRIDLEKGKHTVKYDINGKKVDTLIQIRRASGLFNPIRKDYYVFTRPYGHRENVDSIFASRNIAIDNKAYLGLITKEEGLYIEDFYYNLDQDYPRIFLKSGEKKTDLSKIFNKEDFKQFYFENYQ
ncbi:hypothetical protein [Faecalibacter bovis]|uniref:Uncharacterized protein n=1 Tax=Faecalibacter bovis TaxID=2898187 RepID=A0ABX7XDS2_9FLAO|nr:hypothetical protein [Faecalibacter bovis]QTV05993.1 hypothetical protein J9309_01195 [Faecalibacter bovis]